MDQAYVEVSVYKEEGYKPLVDYGSWRVAILRDCEDLKLERIEAMQKHDETDEVFVLLEGHCVLFIGGNKEQIQQVEGVQMEPLKLYNVKKGTWHTHLLSKTATVLIVENQDTTDDNSPCLKLSQEQKREMKKVLDEVGGI